MIYLFVIIIFKFSYLNAHEITYADSHGPISIMGDHIPIKRMILCFPTDLCLCR